MHKPPLFLVALAFACAATGTPAQTSTSGPQAPVTGASGPNGAMQASQTSQAALDEAQQEITEAVQLVQRMKSDQRVADLLRRARGVLLMTDYTPGSLGVGVQDGEGVLVVRQGQGFSNPVFYNFGGPSVGQQARRSPGGMALLLMTDRAVRDFMSGRDFSIDAGTGLTIADYAAQAGAPAEQIQDVIVWTGAEGAYAGASLGVNEVRVDGESNSAYYDRDGVEPAPILDGSVPNPRHNVLDMVLGL